MCLQLLISQQNCYCPFEHEFDQPVMTRRVAVWKQNRLGQKLLLSPTNSTGVSHAHTFAFWCELWKDRCKCIRPNPSIRVANHHFFDAGKCGQWLSWCGCFCVCLEDGTRGVARPRVKCCIITALLISPLQSQDMMYWSGSLLYQICYVLCICLQHINALWTTTHTSCYDLVSEMQREVKYISCMIIFESPCTCIYIYLMLQASKNLVKINHFCNIWCQSAVKNVASCTSICRQTGMISSNIHE